jgi:uncharacterized glyoxalase superfamily protein PhnB
MTDTATTNTIWPSLTYADAHAGIRFLVEAFGFEERLVVPGERPAAIRHSELRWPEGGGVMLSSAGGPEDDVFSRRQPGNGSCYVVTNHLDDVSARATAAGAAVVREMQDTDYGSRGFSVTDPEGNIRSFGTYAGS